MSLLRDVLSGLFKSIRGFRGAMQTVLLSDGFWRGRQWRAYYRFTISSSSSHTLRLTATKPFMLQAQDLYLTGGEVQAVIYTQPTTQSGPWAPLSTRFGKYLLAGPGTFDITLDVSTANGAITGGQEREALPVAAGGGNAPGSGRGLFGWRALPAGVYYINIAAVANAAGVYSIEIEELD